MSNLGKLSYYLGIEVEQGRDYIELKQMAYVKKVLEKAGMMGCNPTKYPMDPKDKVENPWIQLVFRLLLEGCVT